jgi:hypothetical protein
VEQGQCSAVVAAAAAVAASMMRKKKKILWMVVWDICHSFVPDFVINLRITIHDHVPNAVLTKMQLWQSKTPPPTMPVTEPRASLLTGVD